MALVTPTEVKQILDTTLDDTTIETYITSADGLVNQVLGTDTTLTDASLKSIELFLTAHLIASTREQQIIKAEAGGASVTYQGITGKGLEATFYGQQVLILDVTGKFKQLASKPASIKAVTSFD